MTSLTPTKPTILTTLGRFVLVFSLVGIGAALYFGYQSQAFTQLGVTLDLLSPPEELSLEDGLVGHWTFDGPHITTVIEDQSPENNDVTHGLGTATSTDIGVIGQSMAFDDFNDYWYAPHDTSFDITDDITMSLWVKKNATSSYGDLLVKSPG